MLRSTREGLRRYAAIGALFEKLSGRGPKAPSHDRREDVRSRYGLSFVDPYAFMEEGIESADVTKAIQAERTYHDQILSADRRLNEMADVLYDEFERHVPEEPGHTTEILGSWEYSMVNADDGLPRLLRRPADGTAPEYDLVLDLQLHAHECGDTVPEVRGLKISPDHTHVAFVSDMGQGGERYVGVVRPLGTHVGAAAHDRVGTQDPRVIHLPSVGSLEWMEDAQRLVYVATDKLGRPYQVRCHRLGTPPASDALLFTESDPRRHIQLTKTRDGRLILINSNSKLSSEVLLIDAHDTWAELRPHLLQRGRRGLEYFAEHHRGSLFLLSNLHAPGGDYALYSFRLPPSLFPASPSPQDKPDPPQAAANPATRLNFHDAERRSRSDAAIFLGLDRNSNTDGAAPSASSLSAGSPEPSEARRASALAAASAAGASLYGGETAHLWTPRIAPRPGVHVVDLELLRDGRVVLVESANLRPQLSFFQAPDAETENGRSSEEAAGKEDPPVQLQTLQVPTWAYHMDVDPLSEGGASDGSAGEPTGPAPPRLRCTVESPFIPPQSLVIDPAQSATLDLQNAFDSDLVRGALARYDHRIEWVPTTCGTATVPLSLFFKKPVPGAAPASPPAQSKVLLEAYGAYGLPLRLTFSPVNLSLMDRGFVLAYAHVRGGGELGRSWHAQGRLLHRTNSIEDFLACIDFLAHSGIVGPSGDIALRGHSAAGLLLGHALLRRLPLLGAVIAHRPFFDVLTCLTDPSLDLTVQDYEEFGDPLVPEEFENLRAICPYHNLRPGSLARGPAAAAALPPMRVTASVADRRVPFWGPLKFVARLRHAAESRGLSSELVYCDFGEGDGGGHFGSAEGRVGGPLEELRDAAFLIRHMMASGTPAAAAGTVIGSSS